MQTWVRVFEPCEVQAELYQPGMWGLSDTTVPPAQYMMTIEAPGGNAGLPVSVYVGFDADGNWNAAQSWNVKQFGSHLVRPQDGYTTEEAAELLMFIMEKNEAEDSWARKRREIYGWDAGEERIDSDRRISIMAKHRVDHNIRLKALELLAANHKEEFEETYEASQVIYALGSRSYVASGV